MTRAQEIKYPKPGSVISVSLWYEAGMAHIGLSELFQNSDQIIKVLDWSSNSFIIF